MCFIAAYRRANGSSPLAWSGPKVGSPLALFCIHRVTMNCVNSRNDSESLPACQNHKHCPGIIIIIIIIIILIRHWKTVLVNCTKPKVNNGVNVAGWVRRQNLCSSNRTAGWPSPTVHSGCTRHSSSSQSLPSAAVSRPPAHLSDLWDAPSRACPSVEDHV